MKFPATRPARTAGKNTCSFLSMLMVALLLPTDLFAQPRAVSTVPTSGATAALVQDLTVTFSEAMDPSTITAATFSVVGPGAIPVPGSVSYSGLTATFNPTSSLVTDIWYTATVSTDAKNNTGTPLAATRVWSFVTGPLASVNLGTTAKFALLSGAAITNSPTSAVTGDVGASPIAGSAITGFGLLEITGTIYAADASGPPNAVVDAVGLTAAKGDLTIAYNDAAGRTPIPTGTYLDPGAGNLGGLSLVPGLYKFTGSALLTGADLTLTGGVNDVWIFQIASDLTVGNGRQIILAGGAQAANIFWQVGTSAVVGSNAIMQGTILADQSISLNTGATLNGRALAFSAGVSLLSNTVTRPDIVVPTATLTAPLDNAANMPADQVIAVTFSETMLPSTLTPATFTVVHGITPVAGVVNYSGLTATFTPNATLDPTTVYTAKVSSGPTGAGDSARNRLAGDQVWSFTTASDPTTAIGELDDGAMPQVFALRPNYPNPFNPSTTIAYQLPVSSAVRLEVYDMLGQKVRTLVSQVQPAGSYRVVWDSRNEVGVAAATGMYFYRLQAGDFVQTRRLLLLK